MDVNMKNLWITLLCIFSLNAFGFAGVSGPGKVGKSNSGIRGVSYKNMKKNMLKLANSNSNFATVETIGVSENGVETQGILIRDRSIPSQKLILVTGATHGDEYLNIADRLMSAFLNTNNSTFREYYNRGGAFFVLPILNPYGYKKRTRKNVNRIDLNRDFTNVMTNDVLFTQSETRNIAGWIDNYLNVNAAKLILTMDYHCCYNGTLLFPWGYTKDPIPIEDREDFNAVGELMRTSFGSNRIDYGPVGDILWYLANGSSMDYWYAQYGALAMTFEGRYRKESANLQKHIHWWESIISLF